MKTLHINGSPMGPESFGTKLANYYLTKNESEVQEVNLFSLGLCELSEQFYKSGFKNPTEVDQVQFGLRAKLLEDVLNSDQIVINMPMWNYSCPSTVRIFLDALAVPGKTFSYTSTGIKGMIEGKKVIIITTAGGENNDQNSLSEMLKSAMALTGLNQDLKIIAVGGSARTGYDYLAEAKKEIDKI